MLRTRPEIGINGSKTRKNARNFEKFRRFLSFKKSPCHLNRQIRAMWQPSFERLSSVMPEICRNSCKLTSETVFRHRRKKPSAIFRQRRPQS